MKQSMAKGFAGAVLCAGLACAAQAQAAWVSTGTKALSIKQATALGAAPAATPLHLTLGLKLQNAGALQTYLQRIRTKGDALYGTHLTPAQFSATYAPSTAAVGAVVSYLQAQGFRNVQVAPNRLLVTADGTAAAAQSAFNTSLQLVKTAAGTVRVNSSDAQVPSALAGTVLSVLGLHNIAVNHTHLKHSSAKPAVAGGPTLGPVDLQKAYNANALPAASNTAMGIIVEGDMTQVLADLRQFEGLNGLPQVPVSVQIPAGQVPTDTSGQDEFDLDTQTSTGLAGNVASLTLYDAASLGDSDLAGAFNLFVADPAVKTASASFGGCEILDEVGGGVSTDDQLFQAMVAEGKTLFVSTGDAGAACPVLLAENGIPDSGLVGAVEYPASSPYVVAVGGTTLNVNADGSYASETAWIAGGGGISLFERAPSWQGAVIGLGASIGRGLPDISLDADPNTGAEIIVSGQPEVVGGTSLSAPLANGAFARMQNAHGGTIGFAAPLFYGMASGGSLLGLLATIHGFHDVTSGFNGLYVATPGWDYCTGLGTFDIGAVNALLP